MSAAAPFAAELADPASRPPVQIIDAPEDRVNRFSDLLALLGTALGIVLVLILGAYAEGTLEGITEDVQRVSEILQRLLVAPVNLFSGIVTMVVPAVVVIDLAVRREPRRIVEILAAAAAGFLATVLAMYAVTNWASPELVRSLSVGIGEYSQVSLPAYITGVAALLTASGRRGNRRPLAVSWNILWLALAVAVISGIVALPAALAVVLLGRMVGLAFRYFLGSTADRAYGAALVDGIRRAGFEPRRLVRADPSYGEISTDVDAVSMALGRSRHGRVYDLVTTAGHKIVAVALDADQHASGVMSRWWHSLRLRGFRARADVSLRQSAEATALVSHAARSAGVRTARVLGMAESRESMILIYQRPLARAPFGEIPIDEITDAMLDSIWEQVIIAHHGGISHRSLTSDSVLVGVDPELKLPTVWLSSWEMGEVATSTLAKRIDYAQLTALTALRVGPERAVEAAFRMLGAAAVEQFAPLLQTIVLPRSTVQELRQQNRKLLQQVRSAILARMPDADVENENVTRVGWRTVLGIVLGIFAVTLIVTYFNTEQILAAIRSTNPWWLGAAFGWTMLSFAGAGLALIAFSPIRLPFLRVLLAQVAASYLAIVAPAGVGPAALNLRLLTRRGVPTPLGVATVALVQVSGIVVTVVGLFALTVVTGSQGTLAALPSTTVLAAVGLVAILVALALLVPKVRAWAVSKAMPTVKQTWPRLVEVVGQPSRLALGLGGNLLLTVAYVGAFHATLKAFGHDLALIDITVLFLLGNAAGAIIPTPGGLGTVELALVTGLTGAGLPVPLATSVVMVYRLITYWLRIPLGYVAMKYMQDRNEI